MIERQYKELDPVLLVVTVLLLGLGLLMVFSASYVMAGEQLGDQYYYLRRQALWAFLGLIGLFVFFKIDYKRLRKLSPAMVLVSFILLTMVYVPGLGLEINEARRWITLGSISIQPAEFTKIALVVFSAAFLSSRKVNLENFWSSSFIPLIITGSSFLFIVEQPDLGSALILIMAVLLLIFVAGTPMKYLWGLALSALPILIFFAIREPYRWERLTSFINPWSDPMGSGYHVIQSFYALGPGGWFGVGLGQSTQKFYYLPEPHNDFIFSVIGEELGFLGATAVLFLFLVLIWRGIIIALNAPDNFGSLLVVGIVGLIAFQVVINVGVVTGVLPVTGLNLPLISAGGSSLFFTLCGIGMVMSVYKQTAIPD